MYIARLSLVCLMAFVFMVGCGMLAKKAEMSEPTAGTTEEAAMKTDSDMKTDGDMMEAAVEEVTLNVTGMT
jgi:uncharacterized protein YceK